MQSAEKRKGPDRAHVVRSQGQTGTGACRARCPFRNSPPARPSGSAAPAPSPLVCKQRLDHRPGSAPLVCASRLMPPHPPPQGGSQQKQKYRTETRPQRVEERRGPDPQRAMRTRRKGTRQRNQKSPPTRQWTLTLRRLAGITPYSAEFVTRVNHTHRTPAARTETRRRPAAQSAAQRLIHQKAKPHACRHRTKPSAQKEQR
jgi:hypothetical protein